MLSSTIRLLMRSGSLIKQMLLNRHLTLKASFIILRENGKTLINKTFRRWSHVHYTYPMIESRVMLLLRLFDKINPNELNLDSKFQQDLGLDSLDIVEITAACEDEFWTEIPDCDSDHFLTP